MRIFNKMVGEVERLQIIAGHHGLIKIANYAILKPRFAVWSGCVNGKHHYGTGGLARHTSEVVRLCSMNADFIQGIGKQVNLRVLFLAALYHDIGKIFDYEPYNVEDSSVIVDYSKLDSKTPWRATPHKRRIHHISRSGIEWTRAVAETGDCKDIEDDVLHCILAHHGLREWGSPVFPKSREAWILHHCDSLSARADDCEKVDLVHSV